MSEALLLNFRRVSLIDPPAKMMHFCYSNCKYRRNVSPTKYHTSIRQCSKILSIKLSIIYLFIYLIININWFTIIRLVTLRLSSKWIHQATCVYKSLPCTVMDTCQIEILPKNSAYQEELLTGLLTCGKNRLQSSHVDTAGHQPTKNWESGVKEH